MSEKKNFKEKLFEELRLLAGYTFFFYLFFLAFSRYRSLILSPFEAAPIHWGYNFVEALILSKIILLGQSFHLAEKFDRRPLIIPTLYKTAWFSLFVLIYMVIEEFVIGLIEGKTWHEVYDKFLAQGFDNLLAKFFVMVFVFVFFFAFLQLNQYLGGKKLYQLFMLKKDVE